LRGKDLERDQHPPHSEALRFDHVTLEFPGSRRPAIEAVSFQVERGRFVAVIGPSGCGKITILNLAAGLLSPILGRVHFDDEPVNAVNAEAAYVTQQAQEFSARLIQRCAGVEVQAPPARPAGLLGRLRAWWTRLLSTRQKPSATGDSATREAGDDTVQAQ
jgi:ABC-type protease/lipase transport system fused ATPase/permease subunit